MNLFPYERYIIESTKNIDELCASIDQSHDKSTFSYGFGVKGKHLLGSRYGNEFKLYRAIRYRNSFLPMAIGKITEQNGTSIISISLRMNMFAILFMSLWLFFALFGAIIVSFNAHWSTTLIPMGLFVFGYLLMQGGFWFEVPKIKKLIYEAIAQNS